MASIRQRRQAFTLVETLVVCAIIAVLATVILSATANAQRKSHQTACISNLRQIGQAVQMYVQDNEVPPPRLHTLYPQYVTDKRLFVCALDRWGDKGGFAWQAAGKFDTPPETWPVSVFYLYFDFLYPKNVTERDAVKKTAYRPGYAMCLLHGTETPRGPDSTPLIAGLSLRLCADGSVIERQVRLEDGSLRADWVKMLQQ